MKQFQVCKLGRHFFQIGNGRHPALLQGLYQYGIFYGGSQGMTGKPLGIGDGDFWAVIDKGIFQGGYFGVRTSAARRGIGFMGHENHGPGNLFSLQTMAFFHACHKSLHRTAEMVNIDTGGMKGAVTDIGPQNFRLSVQSPLLNAFFPFDHQRYGSAAQDRTVSVCVKGFGRIGDHVLDRSRAQGQKPGRDPGALNFRGCRFTADDNHPFTATRTNPVFRHTHGLGCGGTGPAHLDIGPLGLDQLGKMGRSQGYDVIQQIAVKLVLAVFFASFLNFKKPVGHLFLGRLVRDFRHQVIVNAFKFFIGFDIKLVVIIIVHLGNQCLKPWKKRGQDNTGGVLHIRGKGKTIGYPAAAGCLPILLHQRNPCILERFNAGRNGQ